MCSSYRLISLLNADVKILDKLLASRLETTMADIISTDQTGFITGRHSFRFWIQVHLMNLPLISIPQSIDSHKRDGFTVFFAVKGDKTGAPN